MFHFLSAGIDETNQAEGHVGRLSHLSSVGLTLVQTQTRRGGGLPQAFGTSLEKALQRRHYTKHSAMSKCSL